MSRTILDPAMLPVAMSNPIFAIKACRDRLEAIAKRRLIAREVLRVN
jgi:hypothetical protein